MPAAAPARSRPLKRAGRSGETGWGLAAGCRARRCWGVRWTGEERGPKAEMTAVMEVNGTGPQYWAVNAGPRGEIAKWAIWAPLYSGPYCAKSNVNGSVYLQGKATTHFLCNYETAKKYSLGILIIDIIRFYIMLDHLSY
jgi:hypothetical protein